MSSLKIRKLKNSIIILAVVLGSAIIALSTLLIIFISKSNTYKLQLENNYKRNFYELVSDINSMEINLSKLIATNSLSSQKQILTKIYDDSKLGATNLSTLPISNHKIENINNYLNTVGGYVYSLLEKNLTKNEKMTEEDYKNIENIYNYCVNVKYELNNYLSEIEDFNIIKQINYSDGELSNFATGLSNMSQNTEEIPTLIYDGPFSESVVNKEIKGLTDREYSESEVREILNDNFKFFDNYQIEFLGDTLGKFATYNYNVYNANESLYVQITKQGAFLLSVNGTSTSSGDKNLSIEDCELYAHNFASLMGIDSMYSVWSQKVDRYVYINLAPIIDGVIVYPDLIKVKIDSTLGIVSGWEASNYAYNHVERDSFNGKLTFDEAQSKLSTLLNVVERNYAIIPNEFVGESFAYEFICTWKDFVYYVYISPDTGEELNIMRTVKTSSGDLLM